MNSETIVWKGTKNFILYAEFQKTTWTWGKAEYARSVGLSVPHPARTWISLSRIDFPRGWTGCPDFNIFVMPMRIAAALSDAASQWPEIFHPIDPIMRCDCTIIYGWTRLRRGGRDGLQFFHGGCSLIGRLLIYNHAISPVFTPSPLANMRIFNLNNPQVCSPPISHVSPLFKWAVTILLALFFCPKKLKAISQ